MGYKRVEYTVDFSQQSNIKCNEFMKSEQYSWQNEFRIAIDFSEGNFSQEILNNVTDFAKITFPGKIIKSNNPLFLTDKFYFEIGNIRDICVCLPTDEFLNFEKITLIIDKEPMSIQPFEMKRQERPTFYRGLIRNGNYDYMTTSIEFI